MNLKIKLQSILLSLTSVVVVSCGSVSSVEQTPLAKGKVYSKVIVKNFTANSLPEGVRSKVEVAKKSFPDLIVQEVKNTQSFAKVSRSGAADSNTLVIDGVITEYDDGNALARMFVGFAAGNSNFDATVYFREGSKIIGSMKVDKSSWALGGALAAVQTADSFIPGAAKKVAKEAKKFSKQ